MKTDARTAAAEEAVVGTLLIECPDDLPPYSARLLEHAPESFDDLRHGTIATAIRKLRKAGKPIGPLTVREQLDGKLEDAGGGLYLDSLPRNAVGITICEFEATALWEAYRRRRVKSVCADAVAAMEADPSKADAVADGVRHALDSLEADADSPCELLIARIFKPDIQPPPLRPIYSLAGHPISTPGNLTSITSAIKTGKSAVIGAMAAAAMHGAHAADLLGFNSSNPRDLALLHFDSEQSPDDHWHQVSRALKRAGLTTPPPWFYSYCLTGLGHKRAWDCVKAATKAAADKHGGVHSVLIDGVADLVGDVNDPAESNDFVAELHDKAIGYDCTIAGVIHFNPGGEKTRGHLGSQLERKAETNLRLDKQDEVTTIWSDKQRRAPIPKGTGPCFRWDDAAGMHVSIESKATTKDAAERHTLADLAESIFGDHPAMKRSDLEMTVQNRLKVEESTAYRRVKRMIDLTVIKKSVLGFYEIARPAESK